MEYNWNRIFNGCLWVLLSMGFTLSFIILGVATFYFHFEGQDISCLSCMGLMWILGMEFSHHMRSDWDM